MQQPSKLQQQPPIFISSPEQFPRTHSICSWWLSFTPKKQEMWEESLPPKSRVEDEQEEEEAKLLLHRIDIQGLTLLPSLPLSLSLPPSHATTTLLLSRSVQGI